MHDQEVGTKGVRYKKMGGRRGGCRDTSAIFCGGPIMWFCRTQDTIPLSDTEEKYMAMAEAVKDMLFARRMLTFMGPGMKLETVAVYEDISGAIHLANDPVGSARSKLVGVRRHFLRQAVKRGDIKIIHVVTKSQHAGLLTKNLKFLGRMSVPVPPVFIATRSSRLR